MLHSHIHFFFGLYRVSVRKKPVKIRGKYFKKNKNIAGLNELYNTSFTNISYETKTQTKVFILFLFFLFYLLTVENIPKRPESREGSAERKGKTAFYTLL